MTAPATLKAESSAARGRRTLPSAATRAIASPVRVVACNPRTLFGARTFLGGSEGGSATPRQPRMLNIAWAGLRPIIGREPALGGAAEHAFPGIVRNSLDQAVAGKLLGLPVASVKDGEGDRPGS